MSEEIKSELKEIILQRLMSSKLPQNLRVSIGKTPQEPMTMQEVVEHVKKEDDIGKKIIRIQLSYLKALKEGVISKIQNE